MLIYGLVFVRFVLFHFFVSVSLSETSVSVVGCIVGNASEGLSCLTILVPA